VRRRAERGAWRQLGGGGPGGSVRRHRGPPRVAQRVRDAGGSLWRPSRMARRMYPMNSLTLCRDGSTTSAIARQHKLQLPLLLGLLDNQSCNHMSRWTCSTCCWGDQGRADRWLRCPRPRWCESSATTRSRFSMSHIAELHFLLPRTNGEHAAPTPSAPFDGGINQLVLHVENGILETFLSMCGTSAPARDYRTSTFDASGAALLLLLLACCCCCCCCWRTLTPPGVRCGANLGKITRLLKRYALHTLPACTLCPAAARFRRFPRTRFPRFPRTKTPKRNIAPIEETADLLGKKPRTPCPAHIFWRSAWAKWNMMELFLTDRHQHLPAATMLHVLDSTPLRHSRTSQCGRAASSRRAAAAARRSARGPHAPRSGSRARTAATSDASAATHRRLPSREIYLSIYLSIYLYLSWG
jgi:hypothetical protein